MLREILSWEGLTGHKGEIVCFGAGMVLLHIEQMLESCGILDRICLIVDNDPLKWGTTIWYAGKTYRISSAEELGQMALKNPLILITCEKDKEIMAQLNKTDRFHGWKAASYPKLNHWYRGQIKAFVPEARMKEEHCIPKIIHYIWFGHKGIPKDQQKLIDSWHKFCYDYEFVLWNESNYDVNQCVYMKEAYETGDYARVCDYARMDILYQYGGFYMDTDVELMKSLETLRGHSAVFAYGEWPVVNSGILCGAVPGHELIRRIRDVPRAIAHYYDDNGNADHKTNCYYEQEILKEVGFRGDFSSQMIDGTAVYSPVYFATKGSYFDCQDITDETIAIHHCAGSWKKEQ